MTTRAKIVNAAPRVRRMTERDIDSVVQLYKTYSPKPLDRERIAEVIRSYPSAVVVKDGVIVGFCYCFRFAPDILEIANIFVAKSARDHKIGAQLVRAIIRQAKPGIVGLIAVNSLLNPAHENKRSPTPFYRRNRFDVMYEGAHSTIYFREI